MQEKLKKSYKSDRFMHLKLKKNQTRKSQTKTTIFQLVEMIHDHVVSNVWLDRRFQVTIFAEKLYFLEHFVRYMRSQEF